jgi:alpha-galactosidase
MDQIRFDAGGMTLIVLSGVGQPPQMVYWGRQLAAGTTAKDLLALATRQGAPGSADVVVEGSLALEPGLGLLGPPGLSAHRQGLAWGSRFVVQSAEATSHSARIICADRRTQLELTYDIAVSPQTGVLSLASCLRNLGSTPLQLEEMATACLPIPPQMSDIIGFTGRWSLEFQTERLKRFAGAYVRENRRGRSSHDCFPAVILCSDATTEQTGEAYGLHLAWSGNHRLRVDTLADGRVFASLGALLLPGELTLAPGDHYDSPAIVAAYSATGLSAMSQKLHRHVREELLSPQVRGRPRPVHYNSWEAVYFNHDVAQLKAMASKAAAIGVERFVLDDGWFGARRHDRAGLGDWTVSADVYPEGLAPLIDHVTGLGMEMGIWFEPEMVNPDSDLFRAHPDWALQIEGVAQVPFRQQYVLDISRAEVSDYLFAQIDAILRDHAIGYVKWDMNRDLNHPGDAQGHPRAHAQIAALWALLDRLRAAHPAVEFESCASGGGRSDYGMLAHTDRVWTSDSNDAIDRQMIQRGASYFLPLCVMGAHVGPRHCHITGRTLPMAMRAATALMGHMGLELNLLEEPEADLAELKQAIALYKAQRALLHSGNFHRLETLGALNAIAVVSQDRSEALVSVAYMKSHGTVMPQRLQFAGLAADSCYRLKLLWPQGWRSVTTPSVIDALDLFGAGVRVHGDALMSAGLQLPLGHPETVLLFHLVAEA